MHITHVVYCRWNPVLRRIVAELGRPTRKRSTGFLIAGLLALVVLALSACGEKQSERQVFFLEPLDGAQVISPVMVRMGTRGLTVEPAAKDVKYLDGHGHHHILVDAAIPSLDIPIPKDNVQHLHFAEGESEILLDLEPGEHTLRLLFAKGDHVPWVPVITDTIGLTVFD